MKSLLFIFLSLSLVSCVPKKAKDGVNGNNGAQPLIKSSSNGIDFTDISPSGLL